MTNLKTIHRLKTMDSVVNHKQNELQLKRIEKRMDSLREEYAKLAKMREALFVLLDRKGTPAPSFDGYDSSDAVGARVIRAKIPGGLHGQIQSILAEKSALSAPEILKALKEKGIQVGGQNPHSNVYVTLKRHQGKIFEKDETGEKWKLKEKVES